MSPLGLTGPGELTLAHQKFQVSNLGTEATKVTYQSKVVMKARNQQSKLREGQYQYNGREAWTPFLLSPSK